MKLSELIKNTAPPTGGGGGSDPSITSIHYSSRDVVPGGLFVAMKGVTSDGHDYIEDAVERGAAAILGEKPVKTKVPLHVVEDARKALADVATAFYGDPTGGLHLIGITGTNGKTTVTYLLEEILSAAGFKVGVIGTVNWRYGGREFPNPRTTPEAPDLQRIFATMLKAGVTHVVMEVSSHALDLFRVRGCRFDLGIFTNLTQDHLDFHGDMKTYWSAKKRFFTEFLTETGARAVVNADDPRGMELLETLGEKAVGTGTTKALEINVSDAKFDIAGIRGTISTPSGEFPFTTTAVGRYNLENILGAVGAGYVMGLDPPDILRGIARFRVPGRLERVENDKGINVFVDYAHTPDALESVIRAVGEHATGKLITVFGCGGDRDRAKRPPMGRIAWEGSALAVVTSDNPRTESVDRIIEDVLTGIGPGARVFEPSELEEGVTEKGYIAVPLRREAINLAVAAAREGDTVLIAGKGHENYQVLGTETIHFDDREEAIHALDKR